MSYEPSNGCAAFEFVRVAILGEFWNFWVAGLLPEQ